MSELAWKLRCAVMRLTSWEVKSTLDCSSAEDLILPKVPELGVPGSASPESRTDARRYPCLSQPLRVGKLGKCHHGNLYRCGIAISSSYNAIRRNFHLGQTTDSRAILGQFIDFERRVVLGDITEANLHILGRISTIVNNACTRCTQRFRLYRRNRYCGIQLT